MRKTFVLCTSLCLTHFVLGGEELAGENAYLSEIKAAADDMDKTVEKAKRQYDQLKAMAYARLEMAVEREITTINENTKLPLSGKLERIEQIRKRLAALKGNPQALAQPAQPIQPAQITGKWLAESPNVPGGRNYISLTVDNNILCNDRVIGRWTIEQSNLRLNWSNGKESALTAAQDRYVGNEIVLRERETREAQPVRPQLVAAQVVAEIWVSGSDLVLYKNNKFLLKKEGTRQIRKGQTTLAVGDRLTAKVTGWDRERGFIAVIRMKGYAPITTNMLNWQAYEDLELSKALPLMKGTVGGSEPNDPVFIDAVQIAPGSNQEGYLTLKLTSEMLKPEK